MHKIKYSPNFLELLNNICDLNNEVTITKSGDEVFVGQQSKMFSIGSFVRANIEHFDFEGDSISFIDFKDFYKFVKLMKNPDLNQVDNKIVISKDSSKMNYLLTDPEIISKSSLKGVKFNIDNKMIGFVLEDSQLDEIKKMIKNVLMDSDNDCGNVRFTFEENKLIIKLHKNGFDNSYEITVDLEKPVDEKYEFEIKSYFFKYCPSLPYLVDISVSESGRSIFRFSYKNDEFTTEFYTGTRTDD